MASSLPFTCSRCLRPAGSRLPGGPSTQHSHHGGRAEGPGRAEAPSWAASSAASSVVTVVTKASGPARWPPPVERSAQDRCHSPARDGFAVTGRAGFYCCPNQPPPQTSCPQEAGHRVWGGRGQAACPQGAGELQGPEEIHPPGRAPRGFQNHLSALWIPAQARWAEIRALRL